MIFLILSIVAAVAVIVASCLLAFLPTKAGTKLASKIAVSVFVFGSWLCAGITIVLSIIMLTW